MNDKTYEIREMDAGTVAKLNELGEREHGRWVPLTEGDALRLRGMNREQRRKWLPADIHIEEARDDAEVWHEAHGSVAQPQMTKTPRVTRGLDNYGR